MSNTTKQALEASLKKVMLQKPLDKITISDITSDCGISRMAFYYHFKDIYDLVEWSCLEDAKRALQGKKTYDTWQEGILQIFEAVLENKPFILNAYHSVSREQIENYLFHLTYDLLKAVVEEKTAGMQIREEQKEFIANFYKYSFVGIMLDWIKQGMKEDYSEIVDNMGADATWQYYEFRPEFFIKNRSVIKILSNVLICKLNFMNKNHSIWAETKISDLNRTTFLERWSLLWQKNTLGLELLRSLQVQELPHI